MGAAILCCVRNRGSLFVFVFSPLMLVVVAFVVSTISDGKLYLESTFGHNLFNNVLIML
ncbi:unnamed protein product [Lupinus luteus]|uniref:Sugar ABC transporter permease n=1 Tax=Lupinus luteus TaxID=3873 RepID=A0AAV1XX01_LUPLU